MLYLDLAVGAYLSQQVFVLRYVINDIMEPILVATCMERPHKKGQR